jgi:hypothetical protein
MQVFGLSGHIIRSGKLASLIAAQSANNEAAIRRAAVCRWRQAIANGLTAEHVAKAVGVPHASASGFCRVRIASIASMSTPPPPRWRANPIRVSHPHEPRDPAVSNVLPAHQVPPDLQSPPVAH